MKHDESISILTIVRPLTLWELPGRGEQVMSDVRLYVSHTVFLPARAHPPYILIAASAAIPPRITNHEPRNLGMDSNGACCGEANPRIPYETQAKVITNCLVPHLYSRRISAAPPRTPHPAPRNLEIGLKAACRGEAKARIPNETQSTVTTQNYSTTEYFPSFIFIRIRSTTGSLFSSKEKVPQTPLKSFMAARASRIFFVSVVLPARFMASMAM